MDDVDFKRNIKEDISWLEDPNSLYHQPGNLPTPSEETENSILSCKVLDSKFMHVVKFEDTKFFDVVTASEDIDPLNIDLKYEDRKYHLLIPIVPKDEDNSYGKSVEVSVQCSTGSACTPQQSVQTGLSVSSRRKRIEVSSSHSVMGLRSSLESEIATIEKYSHTSLSINSTKSELSFQSGVIADPVTAYVDKISPTVQKKASALSENDKKDYRKSNSKLRRLPLSYSCLRKSKSDHSIKTFGQKVRLKMHMGSHSDVRKYTCDHCDKSFALKRNICKHMITHLRLRKYSCKHCGASFARRSTLNRHLVDHSGIEEYNCDRCGKSFARESDASTHLLTHSGSVEYACDQSGQSFTHKSNLNNHLLKHSG